jgi:hypothetical protein
MSGWNASRPAWDSEGGADESTPGFPDPEDYPQPENGRPVHGQSAQPSQPGQPGLPGYDPEDLWQQDRGDRGGYDSGGYGSSGFGSSAFDSSAFDNSGFDNSGHDNGGFGGAPDGQPGYGTQAPFGFPPEDYPPEDFGQQPGQQLEQRDYPQPGHVGRHAGRGPGDPNRGPGDPEHAARLDPALQDFFSPPSRRDFAPQGQPPAQQPGRELQAPQPPQPDYPLSPAAPAGRSVDALQPAPPRDGQPGRPAAPYPTPHGHQMPPASLASQAPWASQPPQSPSAPPWTSQPAEPPQPPQPGRLSHPDPWDAPAPRPATRPASHAGRGSQRGGPGKAVIAVGVVVLLVIVVVAFLVLRKHGSTPANNTPTESPSASHPASARATQPAAGTAYTLSTPATAGGYPKLTTAPAAVSSVAAATAQGVQQHATAAGGKVTGQVAGYYQLSSGQVMSFTGYEGTFDPAKVLAASGGTAFPDGPHGGGLTCAPSVGTPGGTVCVWATTTTLGVTEFFAANGAPETVTNQSKAAQDTLNFRADVEAAKS